MNRGVCRGVVSVWIPKVLLAGLLAGGVLTPLQAQPRGYAHRSGNVYEINLTTTGDLPWSATPTMAEDHSRALAFAPDDTLYAIHALGFGQLATIDLSTGDFDYIGPISLGNDLTVGDDGRLWMVADGSLYLVDPTDATTTEVMLTDPRLLAIASHDGSLFGIRGTYGPDSNVFDLLIIDPDLETFDVVVELDGYYHDGCYTEKPWAMDFDRHGGLWVLVVEVHGLCILPFGRTAYFHYPNPSNGTPGPKRRLSDGGPSFLPGLAVHDLAPVVEVPTLGSWSLGFLVSLLLLSGWCRLISIRKRDGARP